jgi:hypothetical protein
MSAILTEDKVVVDGDQEPSSVGGQIKWLRWLRAEKEREKGKVNKVQW